MYQILQTCSGDGFAYSKGQIVPDMPPERAADLIQAGYAIQIDGSPAAQQRTVTDKKAEQRIKR